MSNLAEDILSNIDIVDVVSRYVELKKSGANFTGLCPFHKEKTPSFVVSSDKQIYKCFGCGAGGNALNFLMEFEKIEFIDAAKMLGKEAGIDLSKYQKNVSDGRDSDEREKIKELNKEVKKFFSDNLRDSRFAYNYLKEERRLSDTVVEEFGLGYAPDSHYQLVEFLKSVGFESSLLEKAGLAKRGSTGDFFSFFRNRIIFPVYDHIGNIVAFAGRAISSEDNPKYLNTPETPVYDKSKVLYGLDKVKKNIRNHGYIMVVEGYMDVIGLFRLNIPVGVATCGTSLTQNHIKLLKRFSQNIIFSFDTDSAGFDATIRGMKICFEADVFPKVLTLPEGFKDLDEVANSENREAEDFKTYLEENTLDSFDFVLAELLKEKDISSPNGRREVIERVFEILRPISDYSVLMLYIEKLSEKIRVNYDVLFRQFKSFVSKGFMRNKKEETQENKDVLERNYVLGALLQEDFLRKNSVLTEDIASVVELFFIFVNYFPDSFLERICYENLEQEERNRLLQAQLRWEKQFETLGDKSGEEIFKFLKRELHNLKNYILKSKNIDDSHKNEVLRMINQIKK